MRRVIRVPRRYVEERHARLPEQAHQPQRLVQVGERRVVFAHTPAPWVGMAVVHVQPHRHLDAGYLGAHGAYYVQQETGAILERAAVTPGPCVGRQ